MVQLILQVQQPVFEAKVSSKDAAGNVKSMVAGFNRYPADEAKVKMDEYEAIVASQAFKEEDYSELIDFIKGELQYLKKVVLNTKDSETGKTTQLKIADTRSAKKLESHWDTPEECLDVLLDAYLVWSSWRASFIIAVQSALLDMDLENAQLKNL